MLKSSFPFPGVARMTQHEQSVRSLSSKRLELHIIQYPFPDSVICSFSESHSVLLTPRATLNLQGLSQTFLSCAPRCPCWGRCAICFHPVLHHFIAERKVRAGNQELKRLREDSWAQIIEGLSGFWGEDKFWMHKAECTGGSFLPCEIENRL